MVIIAIRHCKSCISYVNHLKFSSTRRTSTGKLGRKFMNWSSILRIIAPSFPIMVNVIAMVSVSQLDLLSLLLIRSSVNVLLRNNKCAGHVKTLIFYCKSGSKFSMRTYMPNFRLGILSSISNLSCRHRWPSPHFLVVSPHLQPLWRPWYSPDGIP